MKKIIALLFLALLCLTTVSASIAFGDRAYGSMIENEDTRELNKPPLKEIKEFTLDTHKKSFAVSLLEQNHHTHDCAIFPHPVINKSTPPPNFA